ncbi:MAG: N-acetyltransferase [Trueperaceae bacterium]|nr:N-acetyltransferase [Trueperaceae bacterium]
MNAQMLSIKHNEDMNRFEAELNGELAKMEYMKVGNTLIFTHTEVPESFEGQGIGSKLAKTALTYVKDNEMTAAPLCPFVKSYIDEHPEYKSLVRLGG